jgi:hypothetical protein
MSEPKTLSNVIIAISSDGANGSSLNSTLDPLPTIQLLNLHIEHLRLRMAVDEVKKQSGSMIEIPKMLVK